MTDDASPHLVAIDRVHHGLALYFSDGSSGIYSDALLYSILQQSEAIPEDDAF